MAPHFTNYLAGQVRVCILSYVGVVWCGVGVCRVQICDGDDDDDNNEHVWLLVMLAAGWIYAAQILLLCCAC